MDKQDYIAERDRLRAERDDLMQDDPESKINRIIAIDRELQPLNYLIDNQEVIKALSWDDPPTTGTT